MNVPKVTARTRLVSLAVALALGVGMTTVAVGWWQVNRSITEQAIAMPPVELSVDGRSPADPAELKSRSLAAEQAVRDGFREHTVAALLRAQLAALALIGVVVFTVATLVVTRLLRPITLITSTARRVAEQNLRERIELNGPRDEIRELAETLNEMLSRLDTAFDSQRHFVANASHELRTPLAINRTVVEVAMNRRTASADLIALGEVLLEVNARQQRLIDGLLMLTRSAQRVIDPVEVDLDAVTADLVDEASVEADEKGVTIRYDSPGDDLAHIYGDAVLIEHLVRNLVQNAVRHNVSGGWVEVEISRTGTQVGLAVLNTGPVIPSTSVPRLFEPFRRLTGRSGSVSGSGLGLAIARAVTGAHHGSIRAEPRRHGGLLVEVLLPTADRRPRTVGAMPSTE